MWIIDEIGVLCYIVASDNWRCVLSTALFLCLLAVVFAGLEIEAEGQYGWAEKMPTWYRATGLVPRVYGLFMGGKPLTGYHSFMFFLPIMMFHLPFFMGTEWSSSAEARTWAIYFAWCPLWDYYWFILNPHYGIGRFTKHDVWWHAKSVWVGLWPFDYFAGWGVSLLCAAAGGLLLEHATMLCVFVLCTTGLIGVAPFYRRWRSSMDQSDDRERVLPARDE